MKPAPALLALGLAALAGCGSDPALFAVPQVVPAERIGSSYRTIAVAEVDLPTYGALEEIAVAGSGGAVETRSDTLWADAPSRAVTLELSRALTQITGATVAPEPWPFRAPPEVVVDVRVEQFLAEETGQFRLSGQAFIAPDNEMRRPRARLFDLSVPYDPEGGLATLAAARAQAISNLAILVAREGLR